MPDLIAVAVQELQAIEGHLAALKARADELRAFIKVGTALASNSASSGHRDWNGNRDGNGSANAELPDNAAVPITVVGAVGQVGANVEEPIKVRAIRGVEIALRNGQPKTARQLVQELAAMGMVIGGQEPASNLSAILSQQRAKFRNVKGEGYFLVEPQKTEPVDAETSAGSKWLDPSHAPGKGTATAADDAEGGYGYG
jgi:hypothetical protein